MSEGKIKILVAEDNDLNRKLFVSLLREKGYHVLEASDGEEAIGLIQKESPLLVLMDIVMPKVGGADVLSICREKGFLDNTKVYALTGSEPKDICDSGFDGIIRKPIMVLDFLDAVEKALVVSGT